MSCQGLVTIDRDKIATYTRNATIEGEDIGVDPPPFSTASRSERSRHITAEGLIALASVCEKQRGRMRSKLQGPAAQRDRVRSGSPRRVGNRLNDGRTPGQHCYDDVPSPLPGPSQDRQPSRFRIMMASPASPTKPLNGDLDTVVLAEDINGEDTDGEDAKREIQYLREELSDLRNEVRGHSVEASQAQAHITKLHDMVCSQEVQIHTQERQILRLQNMLKGMRGALSGDDAPQE